MLLGSEDKKVAKLLRVAQNLYKQAAVKAATNAGWVWDNGFVPADVKLTETTPPDHGVVSPLAVIKLNITATRFQPGSRAFAHCVSSWTFSRVIGGDCGCVCVYVWLCVWLCVLGSMDLLSKFFAPAQDDDTGSEPNPTDAPAQKTSEDAQSVEADESEAEDDGMAAQEGAAPATPGVAAAHCPKYATRTQTGCVGCECADKCGARAGAATKFRCLSSRSTPTATRWTMQTTPSTSPASQMMAKTCLPSQPRVAQCPRTLGRVVG